jgi:aerobic-type carbon monoxide dehydrogenase small subunit (CoxS/CutS family)
LSEQTATIRLTVNGRQTELAVPPRWRLVDVLRTVLRLTGTHVGCEHGICGTCTVLVDGQAARSCLILAGQADGCSVQTVEGLGSPERPHPLQLAFSAHRALQCGFCTPGFLMLAADLLARNPSPTRAEIRESVASNICRCTDYSGIIEAIYAVSRSETPEEPAT